MYFKLFTVYLLVCSAQCFINKPDYLSNNNIHITLRFGFGDGDPDKGESELCKSEPVYVDSETKKLVKKDHRKHGDWIEGSACVNAGGDCAFTFAGYVSKCVQKYTYKVLLDRKTGETRSLEYRIPSGCVCSFKKI